MPGTEPVWLELGMQRAGLENVACILTSLQRHRFPSWQGERGLSAWSGAWRGWHVPFVVLERTVTLVWLIRELVAEFWRALCLFKIATGQCS